MQAGRYVAGEWDGGGGGGCIYRSVGITKAVGSGFKIQAYPCLSSVSRVKDESKRELGRLNLV